jgi:hypothetical protein
MRIVSIWGMAMAVLLVSACATQPAAERSRQPTMDRWESLVRWSRYEALIDMIHPQWLDEHPVRPLEMRRLEQFRVTGYRVLRVIAKPDSRGVERHVRIRMYHKRSAYERVIEHRELWRWDEERERWFLHSGLPDPTRS